MIPVRLRLEDFLSYRGPQEVDFTTFEVACLTGANGQGKSSLLDAMTWAVFGAARGCEGGQNQERLIREGAEKASVEYVFELGGHRYRVQRRRSRSGRADLAFDVASEDGWTTLAGDTTTETQTRICDVLRLDYRTFTASAFLLQGRADDFLTRMKPEDRKDVFSRLLDLGVYDRLCDQARTRARDAEGQRKQYAIRIEELRDADAQLDACHAELTQAQERCEAANQAAEAAHDELEARQSELTRIEKTEAAADSLRQAVAELAARLDTDQTTLKSRLQEAVELDALLSRAPEVEAALQEADTLRRTEEELRAASERRSALDVRRTELEGRIAAEERSAQARARQLLEQADGHATEVAKLTETQKRLQEVDSRLGKLDGLRAEVQDIRRQIAELREEHGRLGAEERSLIGARTDLAQRLQILDRGEGECPVCSGPLDEPHRSDLIAAVTRQDSEAAAELARLGARREVVVKEGMRLGEEEKSLAGMEEELQKLAQKASGLRERVGRLPQLQVQERSLREEAHGLLEAVSSGAVASAIRADLDAVSAEMQELSYDPDRHQAVRARLDSLSAFATLKGQIEVATQRRRTVDTEVAELSGRITDQREALSERRKSLADLEEALSDSDTVRAAVTRAREAATEARRVAATVAGEAARLSERLESLRERADDLARARTSELEAASEGRRYSRLATAFGRGGIPDLIIENALPELTQDANEILGRLSDYEMSVQFVMDRLTKAGKVKETFDVLVGHDGGVRDYQMFSGGEAFRIAFSIRLALSKLLLRRAGARMETLVVDEGFGTQDPDGRERLVEAINLARGEFRKVIVITHLDELKEAFGTQIRVSKHPRDGSRAEIVGG